MLSKEASDGLRTILENPMKLESTEFTEMHPHFLPL